MPELIDVLRQHLRFMRGQDFCPILGKPRGRTRDGRQVLALAMRDLGFKSGLEVGTRYGASAVLWCKAMPDLKLTCIDPYAAYGHVTQEKQEHIYKQAQQSIEPFNIQLLRMASMEAPDQFADEAYDFVHIDGDHHFDACVMDLIHYVPKVRKGGLILVHDYCHFHQGGVIEAVDAYTYCHRVDPWYVTRDYEPTAFWQRGAEQI